ncbi:hypothetical protein F2Q69_00047705 [Brassica cretica]|uniref:Uncharacterized protein n=1 Tax=Brassica cretica TaxID=69181 RepID=A0A8S9PZM6_BRACR|nr:hypothetical protein F2Q69_00047705 [Brassica cretica]
MISECGSEVECLAKELEESREKSSQLEGKLKVIEDTHSLEEALFESRIGELEQDLGKTASSLLKAKAQGQEWRGIIGLHDRRGQGSHAR